MSLDNKKFRNNKTGEVLKVISTFENIAILEGNQKTTVDALLNSSVFSEEIDPSSFFSNQSAYNILAEKIKTELCNVSDLNSFEFTIPALSSGPERKLSAATALQIIEPRITEIFELISHAKKELGSDGDQIQSVVLTGGTALTPTISKICSDVFGLETRIGSPDWGFSVPVELKSPRTSVLAGLIQSIN